MKKLGLFLMCIILVGALVIPICASDEYATANELYQAWYDNMPDYISGVWSTDGSEQNLTFGIVESADVEGAKAEILALVRDDSTVSFELQKYSRNELLAVQSAIDKAFMSEGLYNIVSTAVYETQNYVGVSFLSEKKDDPNTVWLIGYLAETYGDEVKIDYMDSYPTALPGTIDTIGAIEINSEESHISATTYISTGIFYAIPVLIVVLIGVSLYRYVHAKRVNKKNPGTYSDDEIRKRKVFFVVFAGIFGVAALVVIGFTALLFMAVAFM